MSRPLRMVLASHLASRRAPTGAERSLALLAAALAQRGHDVTVLLPGEWVLAGRLRDAGVRLVTVPSRPCWLTYWEARPWPLVAWKALRCLLAERAVGRLQRAMLALAPDVVLVNCLPHRPAATAARRARLPFLWHLREILPAGRRRRWWVGVLRRSGAGLLAVSEAVRAWVREDDPFLPVHVVYNGVEIPEVTPDPGAAREALQLPRGGVWVGYLGQLAPHKGVHLVLAAAAARHDEELRVLVAGFGTRRQQRQVEEAARTLLGDRCVVLPPRAAVGPLLAACDIVCVPTLTPDPAPRVVLEAMAAGRVVIGARCGGIPELIQDGETGVLLPATSVAALATALAEVAGDTAARRRLGEAARARAAAHFRLERHVEVMEALLRERSQAVTTQAGRDR